MRPSMATLGCPLSDQMILALNDGRGRIAVVADCDAAESFQAAEHAFNGVAVAVEEGRETALQFAIGLSWNVHPRPVIRDLLANGVGVVDLVATEDVADWRALEKLCARRAIGELTAGGHEGDRSAQSVGQRVGFRRPAAARAADRLIFRPLFRPPPNDAPSPPTIR